MIMRTMSAVLNGCLYEPSRIQIYPRLADYYFQYIISSVNKNVLSIDLLWVKYCEHSILGLLEIPLQQEWEF